jgi:hypothetical protein
MPFVPEPRRPGRLHRARSWVASVDSETALCYFVFAVLAVLVVAIILLLGDYMVTTGIDLGDVS